MYCRSCGKELKAEASFCPGCGSPVGGPAARSAPAAGGQSAQAPRSLPAGALWGAVAAVAVVIAFAVYWFGFGPGRAAPAATAPPAPVATAPTATPAVPAADANGTDGQSSGTGKAQGDDVDGGAATQPAVDPDAEARQEIQTTLDDWVDGVNGQNVGMHVGAYADRVSPYFDRASATRSEIAAIKAKAFDGRYSSMQLSIDNVSIKVSGDTGRVTFSKSWTFTGSKTYRGSCKQELGMTKTADGWKISSEREWDTIENR